MIKRLFIAITSPIWFPAQILIAFLYMMIAFFVWLVYWIITGKNDFEDRFIM